MSEEWQKDSRSVVERLIERGSVYDVDSMEMIYDDDQYILFVEADGSVRRAARAETIAKFRSWSVERVPPLLTEAEFLHVEVTAENAVVLLRRRMKAGEPSNLYELRLRKRGDIWKVSGETVLPWVAKED
ncbi:MAG: hypothetical protein H0X34_07365 [Chthoniobacterales bacterium]|nr:hypothetical protein [Chthoniobacterales bacterium]